jgi:glycolate oxidase iron-sulfur subunit
MSGRPFLDERKALTCVHCGLCLGSCPTFLETGDENESPRGRIYLMRQLQAGRLPLEGATVKHLDRCLGCRACEAVCPSGVMYGELLETTREHIERHYQRSVWQTLLRRVAIEQVFPYPWRMKLALLPVRLARALGLRKWLPQVAELIPETLSACALPEVSPAIGPRRGRVGFVRGCVQSVMFGDTNAATVRLLNRAGYDVITPPDQVCCGALYAHTGNLTEARRCARHNVAVFEREQLDGIIINAAGCGSTLKEYGHLLGTDAGQQFARRVRDLSEVLLPSSLRPRPSGKVTYHEACHLVHAQRIAQAPRDLIRAVAGANFVELPESDVCCGSAGSYNLTEPDMAQRLQQRKAANILRTGAEIVVTTNPGCILQIRAGLQRAGAGHIRVMHLADFLDELDPAL